VTEEIRSGDAVFSFDEEMTVLTWNRAAEALTGRSAEEAVGRPCWEVLGGLDEHGGVFCHANCSVARHAARGWQVAPHRLSIKTQTARRAATVSTIAVDTPDGAPRFLHLLRNGPEEPPAEPARSSSRPALTPRQLEVLQLIAGGLRARTIANRLEIAETTVRNHIRTILVELGCHSQVEALAEAKRWRLVA
jgi:DNA-binding CsgD family transcriptional regulator